MSDSMITGCRFLEGETGMMIVALAGKLPKDASNYTLRATEKELTLKANGKEFQKFPFSNSYVFNELTKLSSIGAIECENDGAFPGELTNLLYVETMKLVAS